MTNNTICLHQETEALPKNTSTLIMDGAKSNFLYFRMKNNDHSMQLPTNNLQSNQLMDTMLDSDFESDEEDYFEDSADSIPSIPFWFGREDAKHVKTTIKSYDSMLGLNEGRPKNSRLPLLFIGKIIREAVEDELAILPRNEEDYDEDAPRRPTHVLVTYDTVYVYEKPQKPGVPKFVEKIVVETLYDFNDGVPVRFKIDMRDEDEDEYSCCDHQQPDFSNLNFSTLQCLPCGGLDLNEFHYTSHMTNRHDITDELHIDLLSQCISNSSTVLDRLKPKSNSSISDGEEGRGSNVFVVGVVFSITRP